MHTVNYTGLTDAQKLEKMSLEQKIKDLQDLYNQKVALRDEEKTAESVTYENKIHVIQENYAGVLQSITNEIQAAQAAYDAIKGTAIIQE